MYEQSRKRAVNSGVETKAHLEVEAPRVPVTALDSFRGIEKLREAARLLAAAPTREREETFQRIEKRCIKENAAEILRHAEPVSDHLAALMAHAREGWDVLHHFRCIGPQGVEEALVYRCIYVPLAYRLGYYTLAPKLAQMTFETLFPALEERVRSAVRRFVGRSELEAHALVHERFGKDAQSVVSCYSRPKTPHSLWKKVGSAAALEGLTAVEFAERVDDYLMVVWIMRPRGGENRFDAILEGARLFCQDDELRDTARRHSCNMADGFPVIITHCLWRGIPVEVQFLGGHVLGWLAAMDYGKYKVGTSLDDIEERLSPAEWSARGDLLLRMYEHDGDTSYEEGSRADFHRLLRDEVLGRPVHYDLQGGNLPACAARPNNPQNEAFVWPGDRAALWAAAGRPRD